jgi:hypothetical protein
MHSSETDQALPEVLEEQRKNNSNIKEMEISKHASIVCFSGSWAHHEVCDHGLQSTGEYVMKLTLSFLPSYLKCTITHEARAQARHSSWILNFKTLSNTKAKPEKENQNRKRRRGKETSRAVGPFRTTTFTHVRIF